MNAVIFFSAPAGSRLDPSPFQSEAPVVPLDRWKTRGKGEWLWNELLWELMLPGFPRSLEWGGQDNGAPSRETEEPCLARGVGGWLGSPAQACGEDIPSARAVGPLFHPAEAPSASPHL